MSLKEALLKRRSNLSRFLQEKRARLSPKEEANFLRQLSLMIESGIHFIDCLDALAATMTGPSRQLAVQVKDDLCQGRSLSFAFFKAEDLVSRVTPSLIKAGEQSGALTLTLKMAADWAETAADMRAKMKSALIYPTFVVVVNLLLAVAMLVYVVPAFSVLFEDEALPFLTRSLLAVSGLFGSKLFWLVAILAAVEAVLFFVHQDHREWLHRFCLHVPVLAPLLREAARARFFSVLSITSRTGLGIVECLQLAAEASGDPQFKEQYPHLKRAVVEGEQPSAHFLDRRELYGPLMGHALSLGEHTGGMEKVSRRMAEFFTQETEHRVEQFQAIMEPLLVVLVSATTAVILLAVYLPLVRFLRTLL